MARMGAAPHYGGQIGFAALLCMLAATGCVTFSEQAGGSTLLPSFAQQTGKATTAVPAQMVKLSEPAATFIVKFRNEPALDTVYRNFRRDEAATRAAYADWASAHDVLKGLRLVRASYSGELILALPMDDPQGRSPYDVIAALETIESLAYAEIDSMATTSERR